MVETVANRLRGGPWFDSGASQSSFWVFQSRDSVEFEVTTSLDIVHGSSSADINARTNMMPTTIEFEVTASHEIVHGSGSAKINMPKRGFQHHVYKSTKTTSSQ